jgi:hypothetical protein
MLVRIWSDWLAKSAWFAAGIAEQLGALLAFIGPDALSDT